MLFQAQEKLKMQKLLLNNSNQVEADDTLESKKGMFSVLGVQFNSTAEEIERYASYPFERKMNDYF